MLTSSPHIVQVVSILDGPDQFHFNRMMLKLQILTLLGKHQKLLIRAEMSKIREKRWINGYY